jgi:hypothetical protein
MNMNHTRALFALLGISLAATAACSSDDTGAPSSSDTSVTSTSSTLLIDQFEVADGVTVRVEQAEQDIIVLSIDGKQGTETTIDALNERISSLADVYGVLAPTRVMPDAVKRVLAKQAALPQAELEVQASGTRALANAGEVDANARVQKEAPRNVASFRSTYCDNDRMLEQHITDGWYRKNDFCRTERTSGFSVPLYDVRQAFAGVYVYRGAADLKWYWQETGAASWNTGGTIPIAEGAYRTLWVYHPGHRNLKFDLVNASGDGFHYAIHSAKANFWEKAMTGTDLYHVVCACQDRNGAAYNFALETCMGNRPEQAVAVGRSQCTLWQNRISAIDNPVACSLVNYEKVTTGKNCNATLPQTFRECTGAAPSHAQRCTVACDAACVPM